MRICLAQINTTPGDFSGNQARVQLGIDKASRENCDLVVFPELCIPGYLSQDLLYNPEYIDRNLAVLEELVIASTQCSPRLHIIVGYVGRNVLSGKPFTNMAAVIKSGKVVGSYQKQLLPFYDVFDELRYFEPGTEALTFEIDSKKVGVAICEDLWNDKSSDNYDKQNNPLAKYREAKVDVLVSLNSSPFVHDKLAERLLNIAPATIDGPTIVYVNQVGGQDELVFDGQSFVVRDNRLLYLNTTVAQDSFDIVDTSAEQAWLMDISTESAKSDEPSQIKNLITQNTVPLFDLLVMGLRDYVRKSGFDELVLASSGGVDSAVVCALACAAIGAKHVHAVRMPSRFSSDHSKTDAQILHKNLGCWDYEMPVNHESMVADLIDHYSVHNGSKGNLVSSINEKGSYNDVADENIQARLRDVYLMHFSNAYGAMPLSTGNKTESGCGYYTHFDMNFSFAPIKDLYKFQVVDLARGIAEIPVNIWQKPPSAELAFGQTDEVSLLPYPVLDPIVMAYVEYYVSTFSRFKEWTRTIDRVVTSDRERLRLWMEEPDAPNKFSKIVSLIGKMEYKRRQTCPGIKVSKVAFGMGRRIPIVEKWS